MNFVKLKKSIEINAPVEKVWKTIIEDETYRQWTAPFSPGSCAESDWNEGSRIVFADGSGNGMLSRIKVLRPYEQITFLHEGMIVDGKEDFDSPEVLAWKGALETYYLEEKDGKTTMRVEQDMSEEDAKSDFPAMWDKALVLLKQLSES